MRKINYHTHTQLCLHASGMEKDYAAAAWEAHLDLLGFSDHAPFPDGRFDLRMEFEELEAHLGRISDLRLEYSGKMNILSGLEIEYCPDMKDYYKSLLNDYKLDYLILGQHYFPSRDSSSVINTFRPDVALRTSLVTDYAQSLCEGMRTGFFAILAHPDVIFINDLPWDKNCETARDSILAAAGETGTILELNANGIRRGIKNFSDGSRYPYPHPEFWKKAAATGLPVMINSDCHKPFMMWDSSMDEAYRLAQDLKLNLVYTLDGSRK